MRPIARAIERPEAGLADARRADEAEDRRSQAVSRQLAHGDELEDALLDLLQAVVIFAQDAGRLGQVEPVLGLDGPGQLDQPLQVAADDADLGRERVLLLQPLDLDQRLGLDLLRHAGGFDLLAQLAGHRCLVPALAQLLLDGADLLAQEVLALLLVHPGLRLGLDLLAQVEHVQPLLDDDAQAAQPLDRIEDLEQTPDAGPT